MPWPESEYKVHICATMTQGTKSGPETVRRHVGCDALAGPNKTDMPCGMGDVVYVPERVSEITNNLGVQRSCLPRRLVKQMVPGSEIGTRETQKPPNISAEYGGVTMLSFSAMRVQQKATNTIPGSLITKTLPCKTTPNCLHARMQPIFAMGAPEQRDNDLTCS